jgi:hypothetical protein
LPIPEQFVHKISDGVVTSEVSDVYHWRKRQNYKK